MVLGLTSIIDCKVWIIILLQLILASTLPIPGRVIRSHRRKKLPFYQKNHFWLVSGLYAAGFILLFCLMKYILRKRRTCCGIDLQDDTEQQNDAEAKDSVTSKHQHNSKESTSTEQMKTNGDNSMLPETKRTGRAIHSIHEIGKDVLMKKEKTLEQDSRHQPVPSVHKKTHSLKNTDGDVKKESLVTATVHRMLPTDNMEQIPSEYDEVDLMEKGLRSTNNDHLPPTKRNPIPPRKSPNHSPAPTMKTHKDKRRNFESIQSELDGNTSVNMYPVNNRTQSLSRTPRYLNQSHDQHTNAGEGNNQIFEHSDSTSQIINHKAQYRGFELQNNANNLVDNIRQTEKQIEEKPVNRVQLAEIVNEIIARRYRKFLKDEQLKDRCRLERLAHPPRIHNPQRVEANNVEFGRNNQVVIDMASQATQGMYENNLHKEYRTISTSNNTERLKINSWSQWSLQTIAKRVNRWTQWSRQTLTTEHEKWTQYSREPSKEEQLWNYRPESQVTDISYATPVQIEKSTQMSLNVPSTVDSWSYRPGSLITDISYATAVHIDKSTQMSLNVPSTVDSWSYRPGSLVTDISYATAVQLDKSTQMSLNGLSTVGSWRETESEMDLHSNVSCSHKDRSTQWSIKSENRDIKHDDAEIESSSDTSVNTVVNTNNHSHLHLQMSTGILTSQDLNVRCQSLTESTISDNTFGRQEYSKVENSSISVYPIVKDQQQIDVEDGEQTSACSEVARKTPERIYTYEYYNSYGELNEEDQHVDRSKKYNKEVDSSCVKTSLNTNADEQLSKDFHKTEIRRHKHQKEAKQLKSNISQISDIRSENISAQSCYHLNIQKEKQSDRRFSKHYQNEKQMRIESQVEDFNRHGTSSTIRSMLQQTLLTEQDKTSTSKYYNFDGSTFSVQGSRTSEAQNISARIITEDNIKKMLNSEQAKETEASRIEVRTPDSHRGSTGTNHPAMYITDKEYTDPYHMGDYSRLKTIYNRQSESISKKSIRKANIESESLESENTKISAGKNSDGKGSMCLSFCCFCPSKHKSGKDNESTTEDKLQEIAKITEEPMQKLEDSVSIDSDSETIISAQSIALRKAFLNDRVIARSSSAINTIETYELSESCNSKRSPQCSNNIVQQWLAQQRTIDYEENSRENSQNDVSSNIRSSSTDAVDIKEGQMETLSSTSMVLSEASNNSAHRTLNNRFNRLEFERRNIAHREGANELIESGLEEYNRKSYNLADEVGICPYSNSIDEKRESLTQKIDSIRLSETLEKEQKNAVTHLKDSSPLHTVDKGTNTKDGFNSNVSDAEQDHTERVETLVCNRMRISFTYQRPRMFRFPRTRRWFNQMRQRWREFRSRRETWNIY